MGKYFETTDIWLAGGITFFTTVQPELRLLNGKVLFIFPSSDAVYHAMALYNSNEGQIFDFAQRMRRLRAEMLAMKKHTAGPGGTA